MAMVSSNPTLDKRLSQMRVVGPNGMIWDPHGERARACWRMRACQIGAAKCGVSEGRLAHLLHLLKAVLAHTFATAIDVSADEEQETND